MHQRYAVNLNCLLIRWHFLTYPRIHRLNIHVIEWPGTTIESNSPSPEQLLLTLFPAFPLCHLFRMHSGTFRQWLVRRKDSVRVPPTAWPDHPSESRDRLSRWVPCSQFYWTDDATTVRLNWFIRRISIKLSIPLWPCVNTVVKAWSQVAKHLCQEQEES